MKPLQGNSFFCSWSGGKDSALALLYALRLGGRASLLVTIMIENGLRSRSHGLHRSVLEAQSQCIGIPIAFASTSWESYEATFRHRLRLCKRQGIHHGVFGDIDILSHREWVERVCQLEGITPHLPLWNRDRKSLIDELMTLEFKAAIVAARDSVLDKSYLGRIIDRDLIHDFSQREVDLCGENGEYHTVVLDGPLFKAPLLVSFHSPLLRDGYWFSDISLTNNFEER